jgi:DNA polymerase
LYCWLPSGRALTYHAVRLEKSDRGGYSLSYEGWNSNPKNGPPGWIRMSTWGGRLVENINQGTCRDILAPACIALEQRGYPVVLHVYDEIVAEIPETFGSVEEFEEIVTVRPAWANDWPIKAPGGYRAKRYRKG